MFSLHNVLAAKPIAVRFVLVYIVNQGVFH